MAPTLAPWCGITGTRHRPSPPPKLLVVSAGHILGFNRPDTFTGANLAASGNGTMGPAVCMEPLQHVELAPLPEGADSIMFSVLKHRGSTCLSADDLQARDSSEISCEISCEGAARWLRESA